MSNFKAAFKKLRPSVVGVGLRRSSYEYEILGTGFFLHAEGWIVTNRHVLEAIADLANANDGGITIRKDAAVVMFVQAPPTEEFRSVTGIVATRVIAVAAPPHISSEIAEASEKIASGEIVPPKFKGLEPEIIHPETLDIGLCQIDPKGLPKEALPLSPTKIIDSKDVIEGTPIGVIGFPRGLSLPDSYSSVSDIQLTPLLQVGVVSGILPMSGDPKPDRFVLDVMINPGSSGSPVFLENGSVIGIAQATRIAFHRLQILDEEGGVIESERHGISIPIGLGLAIPSSKFPAEWLSIVGKKKKH